MTQLYQQGMALVYDEMYQQLIDYEQEYMFYNQILKKYEVNSVTEIGSGTGNLAQRFVEDFWSYSGLDYSLEMIKIASQKMDSNYFMHEDMRNFELESATESMIITGRTISYLLSNEDVNNTFASINRNLDKKGILVFDFIDANRFIPYIRRHKDVVHQAILKNYTYERISNWKLTPFDNFLLEWSAQYFKIENKEKVLLKEDYSTLRVFTKDEMQLFLYLNGFEVLEIIDRDSYAYNTFVFVAQKKEDVL